MYERFVKQLDGSLNCAGRITGGFNCTCASEAMWLYRASQGKIKTTGGHVRDLTNDCSGGTNLRQMREVSQSYGINLGTLLLPGDFAGLISAVRSGRRGAHLNISYSAFRGTRYDCFRGRFTGNHDIYLSRAGSVTGTMRVGDPGADGRYSGCPTGFQNIPISLLKTAAGRLDLGNGVTLNDEFGGGKAYAYLTPLDPPVASWRVSIQPTPPATRRRFYWYEVSGSNVTAKHEDITNGFSASCTQPQLYRLKSGDATHLVKITSGSRNGRHVYASFAHPLT